MIDKNFGEELLHKIKDEKIKPKPRWQFLLKNYVVWGFGVLALVFGALSTSIIFFMLRLSELENFGRAGAGPFDFLIFIIPLFWIICLAVFTAIVFYNFKHTKKGYQYSPLLILGGVISASILIGGLLFAMGFGKKVDDALGEHVPFYDRVMNPHIRFWSDPEHGRLMGLVAGSSKDEEYFLVDMDHKRWIVYTKDAKKIRDAKIEVGRPARFLGQKKSDNEFKAGEVLPDPPGRGFFNRLQQPMPGSDEKFLIIKRDSPRALQNQYCQNLRNIFDRHPDLKEVLSKSILESKSSIKEAIKKDPEVLYLLNDIGIDKKIIANIQE